ncbi:hypothetical protein QUF55_01650 [Clostridiaceae bacterium HSG29]|nr:hypothetical protein [Clostridiaceae bacterium HSG29]
MDKMSTDFSEKKLSFFGGIIFLVVAIYELIVSKNYINAVKFAISAIFLIGGSFIIKERLSIEKSKKFKAGYVLIIIGALIKMFGGIASHIIWILGILLLVKSIKEGE